jgi:hypothetical protein
MIGTAAGRYDGLVTVDQNLPYQQCLALVDTAILILAAKRNDYASLQPLVLQAHDALK